MNWPDGNDSSVCSPTLPAYSTNLTVSWVNSRPIPRNSKAKLRTRTVTLRTLLGGPRMASPSADELLEQARKLRAQLVSASDELSVFTDALRRAISAVEEDEDDDPECD